MAEEGSPPRNAYCPDNLLKWYFILGHIIMHIPTGLVGTLNHMRSFLLETSFQWHKVNVYHK